MSSKITFGAIAVLVGIVVFQNWRLDQLSIERAELISNLRAKDKEISLLQDNSELLSKLESQHTEFESILAEYREANEYALHHILKTDSKAVDWSNSPIPDSLMQLHKSRTETRSRSPRTTGSTPPINAIPSINGKH